MGTLWIKGRAAGCRGGAPLVPRPPTPGNLKIFKKFLEFLGTDPTHDDGTTDCHESLKSFSILFLRGGFMKVHTEYTESDSGPYGQCTHPDLLGPASDTWHVNTSSRRRRWERADTRDTMLSPRTIRATPILLCTTWQDTHCGICGCMRSWTWATTRATASTRGSPPSRPFSL